MKVSLSKHIAGNEQVVVELQGSECKDAQAIDNGFRIMDARLLEMNRRVLVLNEAYKKVVKEFPAAALVINDLIQVLVGEALLETSLVQEADALVREQMAKLTNGHGP
jgi:hypothetical protein